MAIIKMNGYVIGTVNVKDINVKKLEENGFVVVLK